MKKRVVVWGTGVVGSMVIAEVPDLGGTTLIWTVPIG